jgi:hypothetical protein
MGRMACTEPQYLHMGALYLYLILTPDQDYNPRRPEYEPFTIQLSSLQLYWHWCFTIIHFVWNWTFAMLFFNFPCVTPILQKPKIKFNQKTERYPFICSRVPCSYFIVVNYSLSPRNNKVPKRLNFMKYQYISYVHVNIKYKIHFI